MSEIIDQDPSPPIGPPPTEDPRIIRLITQAFKRAFMQAVILLKDDDDAEDAAAKVSSAVNRQCRKKPEYVTDRDLLGGFIGKAANNAVKDHLKSPHSRTDWHDDYVAATAASLRPMSPVRELILKEFKAASDRAIADLPRVCQQVFVLRVIIGLKETDVAERLNISIKTVSKHMKAARAKLQDALAAYRPTGEDWNDWTHLPPTTGQEDDE